MTTLLLTSDNHSGASEKTYKIHKSFLLDLSKVNFDVLILAGDLGIAKFKHFENFLAHVREYIPEKPIVAVRGNHDLWDKSLFNLSALLKRGEDTFKKYNIHHLESGPFKYKDIAIVGWDGWYSQRFNWQNDWNFIPPFVDRVDTQTWLSNRADTQFQRVLTELSTIEGKKIVVTHMPCFPHENAEEGRDGCLKYFEFLVDQKIDYLCYGHTHRFHDEVVQGVRLLNSGSDYDEPKYLTFEA